MLKLAYEVLTDVLKNGAYANLALKNALVGADRDTSRGVTRLVYTTLENLAYEDFIIDAYKKGRLHGSIRNVLRLSLSRLLFSETPDYAAVSGGAQLAKDVGKAGLSGYVNGVLRAIARDRNAGTLPKLPDDTVKNLSIRSNMPEFMVEEYLAEYGEEFTRELLLTKPRRLTVRAQHPCTREQVEDELREQGIAFTRGEYDENAINIESGVNIAAADAFIDGRLTVQSESAMLACRALCLSDGMRVLDACAAPGGKTAYIASLMHGSGSIVALEVHKHRTELINATLGRLKVKNCAVETRDASEAFDLGEFDAVLVDAPCSGLGGSKPDAPLTKTEADIIALAALQQRILASCANSVKKGGALVYSTCTISKRENEDNVRAFLDAHPDFELDDISYLVKNRVSGGVGLTLFPNAHGTDGFYIARLIRKR